MALDGCFPKGKIASLNKNSRGDFPYSESASSFSPTSSLRCVCPPAELRVGMKEADKKFAAVPAETVQNRKALCAICRTKLNIIYVR